jgi:GH24 family phage-related lysozyme (muramidase)
LSDIGLTDIKNFEGLRGPRPSDLTGKRFENVCGGKHMIGYGHVLTDSELQSNSILVEGNQVSIKEVLSAENALKLLKQDIKAAEGWVKSACGDVPLTQQQFDALVDLAWNIGEQKFNTSKLVKLVKEKNYNSVTTEFIKWCQACGVIRADLQSRRKANALRWCGIMRPETPVPVSSIAADGDVSPMAGSGSAAEAMAWFQSAQGGGYSKAQAAGITANLIVESGLRPGIKNPAPGSSASGIAQWTNNGGRKQRVEQFLNVRDVREASFQQQLTAVTWELSTGEAGAGRALRATNDVDNATETVWKRYERPGPTDPSLGKRVATARQLFSQ